jgi:hypothetical protein
MVPLAPTIHASPGPLPQTPWRSLVVPLGEVDQATPPDELDDELLELLEALPEELLEALLEELLEPLPEELLEPLPEELLELLDEAPPAPVVLPELLEETPPAPVVLPELLDETRPRPGGVARAGASGRAAARAAREQPERDPDEERHRALPAQRRAPRGAGHDGTPSRVKRPHETGVAACATSPRRDARSSREIASATGPAVRYCSPIACMA